jgi:hypothetical protein
MPPEREYSARDAGTDIVNAGLADDVVQADERDLSDKRKRNDRSEREDKRNARNRREDVDDDSDEDGEEYEDDEAGSGSNRDDGESEDDGDEDTDDDDSDEGEDGESRAQSKDKFEVTVNGEKLKVTRDELVQGYQRNEDYHRKTQGLAQERRSFVDAHTKVATSLQRAMQNTQGVLHQVLDVIAGSVDSPQMQHLRQTNPDQWTRERMAIQDQREKIAKILQDSLQEQERLKATSLEQNGQDQSALARATVQQMQKHVPDWLTPGKDGATGAQRLLKHLVQNGFQEAEVKSVLDPRMLLIADKARRYDEIMAKGGKAAEQHRKARNPPPKPPKGRGSEIQRKASKETARSASYRQARAKAKQSGDMRDAGDAINKLYRFDR